MYAPNNGAEGVDPHFHIMAQPWHYGTTTYSNPTLYGLHL